MKSINSVISKKYNASSCISFAVSLLKTIFLICMSFIVLYPIIYMFSMAFRASDDLHNPLVIWVPLNFTLENFIDVIDIMNYKTVFLNTFSMALICTVINMALCASTAYGLARFKFRLSKLVFFGVVFTIIVPMQCISTPLYLLFKNFDFGGIGSLSGLIAGKYFTVNLLDTLWPMVLPALFGMGLRSGLFIYIFQQFFRGLPKEIEDAAYIDGCSIPRTFVSVMLPNSRSAIISCTLFSFVWYWNDYHMTSLYFNDIFSLNYALSTLADALRNTGLNSWVDPYSIVTRMQAGCLLVIFPMLIIYVFLQRFFTESIDKIGIVG